jgi:uncharacterized protein YraI
MGAVFMLKRLLGFGLIAVLVICLLPAAALGAGANSSSNYRRFQAQWDAYTEDVWSRSFDDPDIGADVFSKEGAYVYGYSTEGGEIFKYYNTDGSVLRYRLELYGESGASRYDYYFANNTMFVSDLRSNYSSMSYFPGSEILYYEFNRYVQSGGKWYQMDDINKQANPISDPDLFSLSELDAMLTEGDPIEYDDDNGGEHLDIPEFPYTGRRASLNQNMATRTGPNTKYTEPGTFPRSTDITVFYQTSGNGVMWGMVEFKQNGEWYRLYTGMKRIDANNVPKDPEDYIYASLSSTVTPRYGPGTEYALQSGNFPAGGNVKVFYKENGYAMVDYEGYSHTIRGWVPLSALSAG